MNLTTCKSCHHWKQYENLQNFKNSEGTCTRFPPTVVMILTPQGSQLTSMCPNTAEQFSCGEFRIKGVTVL